VQADHARENNIEAETQTELPRGTERK